MPRRDINKDLLPEIDWSAQPLGQESDNVVARRLDVSVTSVAAQRRKRNITPSAPSPSAGVDWDKQPLGKLSDAEIARQVGVTTGAAKEARVRRGIPRFSATAGARRRSEAVEWDKQPLGKMSDAKLAKSLDLPAQFVIRARSARGIPAWGPNAGIRVKGKIIDWDAIPLGKVSDAEAGRMAGCGKANAHDARTKRGIPAFVPIDWSGVPFGTVTDSEIAASLGVTTHTVFMQRRKRGIRHSPQSQRKVTFDWDDYPLGTVSDRIIAEQLGVCPSAVAKARTVRGIVARFPKRSRQRR